jgi:hypothetical protein
LREVTDDLAQPGFEAALAPRLHVARPAVEFVNGSNDHAVRLSLSFQFLLDHFDLFLSLGRICQSPHVRNLFACHQHPAEDNV